MYFMILIKYLKNILLIIFYFRLNINRLQSMAQIHSFYITNAQSELKFSSNNLNENELETALQDITSAMIDNSDLFGDEEEEDNDFSDNDSINLDEENTNDLIIAELMDLDIPEFGDVKDSRNSEDSGKIVWLQMVQIVNLKILILILKQFLPKNLIKI